MVLALAACSSGRAASDTGGSDSSARDDRVTEPAVLVEVISLDHAPIRPAVEEVLSLAEEYGSDVIIRTYSFDSAEGEDFAAEKGITEHLPLAVFINGVSEFTVDGRTVLFESFPQGEGTGMVADGTWTITDLRAVLDRATR
jgi:hypothetical protein